MGFFRASSALFFILGMLVMLLSQWVFASLKKKDMPLAPEATARRLFEYSMVHLDVPDSLLPASAEPLQSTRWVFEKSTPEQLSALFANCDLTPGQKEILGSPKNWQINATGITLQVAPEVILGLSRPARDKIYAVLAQSQANPAHATPFKFSPDLFEGILASSELTGEQVDQVKRLAWTHAGAVCFSDLDLLKGSLPPAKFKELVETLYSVPALLMRLRVSQDTDVEALLKYWGKGGRLETIKPLVESLARATNGTRISVEYFLPPFARLRLNTFPNPEKDPHAIREDCFWSAMNFFNETPDPQYFNQQSTIRALKEDYIVTKDQPVFGDRIMLLDAKNEALHMCVYIADGVVFTKNGSDFKSPWILMKLSDMLALYPSKEALRLMTYRPKNA
jgi:hypothetical protein